MIDIYRNTEVRFHELPAIAATGDLFLPYNPARVAVAFASGGTSFVYPHALVDATIFGIPVNQQSFVRLNINDDGIIVTNEWYCSQGTGNGIAAYETVLLSGSVYSIPGVSPGGKKPCRMFGQTWQRNNNGTILTNGNG